MQKDVKINFRKIVVFLLVSTLLIPGYSVASETSSGNEKIKIAVIDLVPLKDVDSEVSKLLTDIIRDVVFKTGRYRMLTKQDMQTILERASLLQQLGLECDTDKCMANIAGALGVEQMIAGNIGKIGKTFLVSLRLVDSFQGRTINTQIKKINGTDEELINAVSEITGKLFYKEAEVEAKTGKDILVIEHTPVAEVRDKEDVTVSVKTAKKKIRWWQWALGVVVLGAIGAIVGGTGGGGGDSGGTGPGPQETKTGSTTVTWIE